MTVSDAPLVHDAGMERLCPANDNAPNVVLLPPRQHTWDIYRAARRGRWIGRVIAVDAGEAIEAAAVVFNTDVRRLIAVRIWEA